LIAFLGIPLSIREISLLLNRRELLRYRWFGRGKDRGEKLVDPRLLCRDGRVFHKSVGLARGRPLLEKKGSPWARNVKSL